MAPGFARLALQHGDGAGAAFALGAALFGTAQALRTQPLQHSDVRWPVRGDGSSVQHEPNAHGLEPTMTRQLFPARTTREIWTKRASWHILSIVRDVVQALLELLTSRQRGALATVVRASGSTPQRPGARLLLRDDGSTLGTVGGGGDRAGRARELAARARLPGAGALDSRFGARPWHVLRGQNGDFRGTNLAGSEAVAARRGGTSPSPPPRWHAAWASKYT